MTAGERAAPSTAETEALRSRVLESLAAQGFALDANGTLTAPRGTKDQVRQLHAAAVAARRQAACPHLAAREHALLAHFAKGSEIDPTRMRPVLRQVTPGSSEEILFRYARLHWSVPVSAGYGRRLRFLVVDEQNGKLIGLIGLGDPVIRLRSRDQWVGWDGEALHERLRHVMDAFVLGAVPPYDKLLGGKLVALLATSTEVREAFRARYEGGKGLIRGEPFSGDLALLTTQSALGRSSMYNRLAIPSGPVFLRVGETMGSGEFHFSNGVYAELLDFARRYVEPTAKHATWGGGFRNRREVVRSVLRRIDLDPDLVYHGIRRELYCVPLASNTREFLCGREDTLDYWTLSADDIFEWFRGRWLLPRAARVDSWRDFDPESLRLWPQEGSCRAGDS